jgi:hypothetical protein
MPTIVPSRPTVKYLLKSTPPTQAVINEYYEAKITPIPGISQRRPGYDAFELYIKNRVDRDLEVVWDKTLFIDNGKTNGGFMFEGVVYKDRNNPKPPDMVFASGEFTKKIWPCTLVSYLGGRYGGWVHEKIHPGDNGVYLTIRINGKDITEKLILNVEYVQEE